MEDWTKEELAVAVVAYRQMQAIIAAHGKLNKAQMYRELSSQHGRSAKSWEYRMQNISHVLNEFGQPWIEGLKPASNVGPTATMIVAELLFEDQIAPTATSGATAALLLEQSISEDSPTGFLPADVEDQRRRVLASIVRRRGQSQFRRRLLSAYGSRCAVTSCDVVDVLEAAHIHPYLGESSNVISNGLLLRADIHTLFDLYLISFDPHSRRLLISPDLENSSYNELAERELSSPMIKTEAASTNALEWHRAQCAW